MSKSDVVVVARIIDEKHRARLMLEASMKEFFRAVNLMKAEENLTDIKDMAPVLLQSEMSFFEQWGECTRPVCLKLHVDIPY
jgi:hypothetical protein